jgi:hypothetical protein
MQFYNHSPSLQQRQEGTLFYMRLIIHLIVKVHGYSSWTNCYVCLHRSMLKGEVQPFMAKKKWRWILTLNRFEFYRKKLVLNVGKVAHTCYIALCATRKIFSLISIYYRNTTIKQKWQGNNGKFWVAKCGNMPEWYTMKWECCELTKLLVILSPYLQCIIF